MNKLPTGVRIRKYPSGRRALVIAFSYRGRECRETLKGLPVNKANEKYAGNLRAEIKSLIQKGTFNYAEYFPGSPNARLFGHAQAPTVREAQAGMIEDLRTAGREETTLATYQRSAARINQHISNVRLSDLVPEHFREMLRKRQVSRKSWNNDLILIRKALRRAVMDGVIQSNPLDRIDIDELVPAHKRPAPDPFSLPEIAAILAVDHCPRARNLIQTALYTGLRLEELAALTWANVDFNAGRLYVTHAAQLSIRKPGLKAPKTPRSARSVDLLPKAVEALKRQQAVTRFHGERVFTRWTSYQPFTRYKQLRRRWNTIIEKSGVRRRAMKHCRHTYASHMLSSGHNPLYVAGQLGHSGTALLDVYARWVDDWKDLEGRKYGT